ncbi:MAG TPA: energy transducer TonB [Terracidiphilus sp.]
MFEDSTFESAHRIRTRSRGWSLAAFVFNGAILAALIAIPLIYPEALPQQMMSLLLVVPPPPPAASHPVQQQQRAETFHGTHEFADMRLTVPQRIPGAINNHIEESAPGNGETLSMGDGGTVIGADPFGKSIYKPPVVVRQEPRGLYTISRGVAEGMLINRVVPHYPPIALASRTQGAVVLQAVISKAGAIENLRVVSGSPMLQQAALEAVRQWRYRPYLLNGEPVEVETTIHVVFNLN